MSVSLSTLFDPLLQKTTNTPAEPKSYDKLFSENVPKGPKSPTYLSPEKCGYKKIK